MKEKPTVGMRVRLNGHGFATIGGLKSWEEVKDAAGMTIVGVGANLTSGQPTYPIEVSGHALRRYIITQWDVDELPKAVAVPTPDEDEPVKVKARTPRGPRPSGAPLAVPITDLGKQIAKLAAIADKSGIGAMLAVDEDDDPDEDEPPGVIAVPVAEDVNAPKTTVKRVRKPPAAAAPGSDIPTSDGAGSW